MEAALKALQRVVPEAPADASAARAWAEARGRVEVLVGTSSRDGAALRGHFVVP